MQPVQSWYVPEPNGYTSRKTWICRLPLDVSSSCTQENAAQAPRHRGRTRSELHAQYVVLSCDFFTFMLRSPMVTVVVASFPPHSLLVSQFFPCTDDINARSALLLAGRVDNMDQFSVVMGTRGVYEYLVYLLSPTPSYFLSPVRECVNAWKCFSCSFCFFLFSPSSF